MPTRYQKLSRGIYLMLDLLEPQEREEILEIFTKGLQEVLKISIGISVDYEKIDTLLTNFQEKPEIDRGDTQTYLAELLKTLNNPKVELLLEKYFVDILGNLSSFLDEERVRELEKQLTDLGLSTEVYKAVSDDYEVMKLELK